VIELLREPFVVIIEEGYPGSPSRLYARLPGTGSAQRTRIDHAPNGTSRVAVEHGFGLRVGAVDNDNDIQGLVRLGKRAIDGM
jgi:hypothetical protein